VYTHSEFASLEKGLKQQLFTTAMGITIMLFLGVKNFVVLLNFKNY